MGSVDIRALSETDKVTLDTARTKGDCPTCTPGSMSTLPGSTHPRHAFDSSTPCSTCVIWPDIAPRRAMSHRRWHGDPSEEKGQRVDPSAFETMASSKGKIAGSARATR